MIRIKEESLDSLHTRIRLQILELFDQNAARVAIREVQLPWVLANLLEELLFAFLEGLFLLHRDAREPPSTVSLEKQVRRVEACKLDRVPVRRLRVYAYQESSYPQI